MTTGSRGYHHNSHPFALDKHVADYLQCPNVIYSLGLGALIKLLRYYTHVFTDWSNNLRVIYKLFPCSPNIPRGFIAAVKPDRKCCLLLKGAASLVFVAIETLK